MSRYSARNEKEKTKSAEIGNRLLELRKNYGKSVGKSISQGDFGAVLGIGGDTQASRDTLIGRLERGECDIKPSELQRYSEVCGVSIDYIVNGSEHKEPPAEFSFVDLCRLIKKLDECRLIDLISEPDSRGIVFRNIPKPEPIYIPEHDRYINPIETDLDKQRRWLANWLCEFIVNYTAGKRLKDNAELNRRDWLSKKAIEGAIDDFETVVETISHMPSVDKFLQATIEEDNEKLPFE